MQVAALTGSSNFPGAVSQERAMMDGHLRERSRKGKKHRISHSCDRIHDVKGDGGILCL